jgi:hypothetical protein
MVSAYFLCHGHWTVIPHQLKDSFLDMRDCGFNTVAMSFSESEMRYSRRAVELQIRLARAAGLRVLLIPSRLGGRFAGAPWAPSFWLAQNPNSLVPDNPGWPVACLEDSAFRDWIHDFVGTIVRDYEIDGIVWDEPKSIDLVSKHPATLMKFGGIPTVEQAQDGFVEFLAELTSHCLSTRPGLQITLFCQKTDPERFTSLAASIPGITFHGYDGNLARQSYFHEEPQWLKYRIESVWDRTQAECEAARVGTFALIENMLMPSAAIPEYEENLERVLQTIRPAHLSLYYYAHNNEDPHRVHEITRRAMQRHLR